MKNWKTSIGGIVAAAAHIFPCGTITHQLLSVIGIGLLGWAAEDAKHLIR